MEFLQLQNTIAPFGIESSGGIKYLKVLLKMDDTNHQFVKDRLEYFEQLEAKKLGNFPIISNIRKLKDNNDLLRIKIKTFKNKTFTKINYDKNCLKEDYLKTLDELTLDAKIHTKISIGKGYTFQVDGETKSGLNIQLEEVTIL